MYEMEGTLRSLLRSSRPDCSVHGSAGTHATIAGNCRKLRLPGACVPWSCLLSGSPLLVA